MTTRERLNAVRRELVITLVVRAALFALAAGVVALAIARAVGARGWAALPVIIVAAITLAFCLPRAMRARSLERVALWIEERNPSLQYAVVTSLSAPGSTELLTQALAVPWWRETRRVFARALVLPLLAVVASCGVLLTLPHLRAQHSTLLASRRGAVRVNGARGDPLAHVRVVVTAPAYSGRPVSQMENPTSVDALVASLVTVSGEGDAADVVAMLDSIVRPVRTQGGRWMVTLAMPSHPALLRLATRSDSGHARLVVLAPVIDAPPAVTLLLPMRDTVMRAATGTLLLRAQLRDDIGLHDARFELVISSGQDENFTFRSTTVSSRRLDGRTEQLLEGRVSLDSLALKPGDVLQLRAVARDANVATGPGIGSSETRSLRVARAGEYDSVSVDAAPPGSPEAQVLSQRMLITLTEALERRRTRLPRQTLVDESRRIAVDQARLRTRVGDIVFQRTGDQPLSEETSGDLGSSARLSPAELLARAEEATRGSGGEAMDVEGDETPILGLNKPLLEAFNAMWDAGRALEQGETNRALPPMRRALAAIERARQAERIYLRGRPSLVVVDIAKARLAGTEKGSATEREARVPIDPVAQRRSTAFAHATALLASDPAAAADTLLVMRVDALETAPALAAALEVASHAAREARSANEIALAWAAVRRALVPLPVRGDAAALWSGVP